MITFIFISIIILTLYADFKAFRKIAATNLPAKAIIAVIILLLNILPFISVAITALCSDNSHLVMSIASWIITIYVLLTLVRIAFYIGFLTISKQRLSVAIGTIFAIIVFTILINGIINTRTNLNIKNIPIQHNNIPASFDNFRILFFSDLHIGSLVSPEREIAQLVDVINSQKADMVIFGGDMVHIRYNELSDRVIKSLSNVKAPYGVYTVLGNHDTGTYIMDSTTLSKSENIARLNKTIRQAGWELLQDSTIYAIKGADSIAITGIDFTDALLEYKHSFSTPDNFDAQSVFKDVSPSLFNIAVSHLPQLWHPISDNDFAELTLSGHVHATQIAVECFGKRLSPAMLMYKEWSGLYRDKSNYLYITDGIGCVGFYMRIGARPEVTVIELKK